MEGKLFVVSACSGAGKTTLVEQVMKKLINHYTITWVVTYTSKTPRIHEINGKDYHFISISEFEALIQEEFFLEWSLQYGTYYGSPAKILEELALGRSCIIIVDLAGAQALCTKIQNAVLIWIEVKDLDVLKTRLLSRNTENYEQIQKRLALAHKEINQKKELTIFKYEIVNECFEKALWELELIVVTELKNSAQNRVKNLKN